MKKLNYNNKYSRLFYLIGALFPTLFFIFLRLKFNWMSNIETGSIIIFCFWLIVSFVILIFNCLDVDIYAEKNYLRIKSLFKENKIEDLDFEIKSIFLLTMFFNVYKINFKTGKNYIFKHLPVKPTSFFSYKINAQKIQEIFITALNS